MASYGYRKIEIVRILLNHSDIDVNIQDDVGYTALNYASEYGETEIVELLIAKGGREGVPKKKLHVRIFKTREKREKRDLWLQMSCHVRITSDMFLK